MKKVSVKPRTTLAKLDQKFLQWFKDMDHNQLAEQMMDEISCHRKARIIIENLSKQIKSMSKRICYLEDTVKRIEIENNMIWGCSSVGSQQRSFKP